MPRCPRPINGLFVADIEEDEKEEDDGGVEGGVGKEFEEAAVEAIVEENEKITKSCRLGTAFVCPPPPEAWLAPAPKTLKGESAFAEVDNPGSWSQYTYRAEFDSKGQYSTSIMLFLQVLCQWP
jgi:hypothetical protein